MAYLDRITKNTSFDDINQKNNLGGCEKTALDKVNGVCMRFNNLFFAASLLASLFAGASFASISWAQDGQYGAPAQLSDSALQVTADAPPIALDDPLAAFRKATADNTSSGPSAPSAPAAQASGAQTAVSMQEIYAATDAGANSGAEVPGPTAGGFQQGDSLPPLGDLFDLDVAPSIEEQEAELLRRAREDAFDAALNGMMPMSPEQIRALLDKYRVTRQASEERIGGVPTPEITVQTVSLEPGSPPPVIKLSPGHVTTVTMLDMSGQPWPVQDVSWGGNFEVISPGNGGHLIRVSPMAAHEVGNMSVQMVGLKTPVTFMLQTQLEVVQYRFDAMIPEYGPMASPPLIDQGVTTVAGADKVLSRILDGTPPAGANKLQVSGVDGRTSVFRVGGTTYLRTPLTLLSPGWDASMKSADGMTVYVVHQSPVLLLSDRGRMVRAVVQETKVVQ